MKASMKVIALISTLPFGSVCEAQTKPPSQAEVQPCLIVKHAGGFSAFANNANWEYIAGDFPKGFKWRVHLTDRNLRKIKEIGGRIVILEPKAEDLAHAQERCSYTEQNVPEKKP